jgi:hypothetical protein
VCLLSNRKSGGRGDSDHERSRDPPREKFYACLAAL